MFKRELDELLSKVNAKQIILMTHDGPAGSSTAIDRTTKMNEGDILFGSPYLYNLLKEDKGKKIIANVHGHVHDGSPADKITDGVRILNPGSLKFGEFAELILRRDKDTGVWRVA
jgi:Icc-related predicted phosphoesterase